MPSTFKSGGRGATSSRNYMKVKPTSRTRSHSRGTTYREHHREPPERTRWSGRGQAHDAADRDRSRPHDAYTPPPGHAYGRPPLAVERPYLSRSGSLHGEPLPRLAFRASHDLPDVTYAEEMYAAQLAEERRLREQQQRMRDHIRRTSVPIYHPEDVAHSPSLRAGPYFL